jgi:hypothetical protein
VLTPTEIFRASFFRVFSAFFRVFPRFSAFFRVFSAFFRVFSAFPAFFRVGFTQTMISRMIRRFRLLGVE